MLPDVAHVLAGSSCDRKFDAEDHAGKAQSLFDMWFVAPCADLDEADLDLDNRLSSRCGRRHFASGPPMSVRKTELKRQT